MESVGFTRQQAEMMAEKQAELIDDRLATKDDLESLRLATKSDLADVRADIRQAEIHLEAKIAETKAEILKWMFGAIGFQTFVLLGALVALTQRVMH